MVKLNKIYTRKGDKGQTDLGDRSRISKSSKLIKAIGLADQTNAFVGYAKSGCADEQAEIAVVLFQIEHDLFDIGADLSCPLGSENLEKKGIDISKFRIDNSYIDFLEINIDKFNEKLPDLKSFVLPSGNELSSRLHLARVTCRSFERELFSEDLEKITNPIISSYINRLSDLLFVLSRYANSSNGSEELWDPHYSKKH